MSAARPQTSNPMRWSVVIPYYNEEDFIGRTLDSLGRQSVGPFRLILVDNASTDSSRQVCTEAMAKYPQIETHFLREANPGQIHALETGLGQVDTEFVAICDADTFYPPHYLEKAQQLFDARGPKTVAVMAHDLYTDPQGLAARIRCRTRTWITRVLRRQAHTGGYAHSFRADVLRRAGGYSLKYWNYVLYDHELMQRVFKFGESVYDADMWCLPSPRRSDRGSVTWTLAERILYHLTWFPMKDWFFYKFLAARFERRGLHAIKIREKTW